MCLSISSSAMWQLILVLTPIALADSLSVIPMCIVPLSLVLSSRRPLLGSTALIAGIVLPYYALGVMLVMGLGKAFSGLEVWLKTPPDTIDLVLQLILGAVLLGFGMRLAEARQKHAGARRPSEGMTPGQAFTFGFGFTVLGAWGAFPYFAAIDQMLKADLSFGQVLLVLAIYSAVFVSILVALVVLHFALGARADAIFASVQQLSERWGRRLAIVILLGLGAFLVADGVGWFMGAPLIPIS